MARKRKGSTGKKTLASKRRNSANRRKSNMTKSNNTPGLRDSESNTVDNIDSDKNKLRIAIDFNFEKLLSEEDIAQLSTQLQKCYSIKNCMNEIDNSLELLITCFTGKILHKVENDMKNYTNLNINHKSESLCELFDPEDVVYLSTESENVLAEFNESKVYVIGGFVNHNPHGGLSYRQAFAFRQAVAAGFEHARLPLDSVIALDTYKMLNISHIFEIIVNYRNTKNWKTAIKKFIYRKSNDHQLI